LKAENAALRQQLVVLQRQVREQVQFTNDVSPVLYPAVSLFPSVLKAITIIRPGTPVRWQRAGFHRYWRWKSRSVGGRRSPQICGSLIRRVSVDNLLWDARVFMANCSSSKATILIGAKLCRLN
jgi:hypothetical protein